MSDNTSDQSNQSSSPHFDSWGRIIAISGYVFITASALCFTVIAFLKLKQESGSGKQPYSSWLELIQNESTTISLFIIAMVAASLGIRLLTSVRSASVGFRRERLLAIPG